MCKASAGWCSYTLTGRGLGGKECSSNSWLFHTYVKVKMVSPGYRVA